MIDSPETSTRPRRDRPLALDHVVLALAPIRAGTAVCLLLAGVLVLVGVATVPGDGDSTRSFHDSLVASPGLTQLSDLALHAGWTLLAVACVGLTLIGAAGRGPLLIAGAVLAAIGLTTLPGLFATDAYDLAMAQELPRALSVRLSEQAASTPLAAGLFISGSLGAALGPPLLLAALWRRRLVPLAAAPLALVGPIVSAAGGHGATAVAGAGLLALGYGCAAWALLRR